MAKWKSGPSGKTAEQRFWEKVDKAGECWIWMAYRNSDGYGMFKATAYHLVSAHRYIYEQECGPIPDGHYVCHTCDVPACVNPAHLFVGTQKENVNDMFSKRRDPKSRGTLYHPWNAKLTPEEVLSIRSSTLHPTELAHKYNVHWRTIYRIRSRDTWKTLAVA